MEWQLAKNASPIRFVIFTRGYWDFCLRMCKLIVEYNLIWSLALNVICFVSFHDTHLCMIAKSKHALDIHWNRALWGNTVCDLLTCKDILNFLFFFFWPKEIKFLDVPHFVGKENHRHSSLSSTGLHRINHAVPALPILICVCFHI